MDPFFHESDPRIRSFFKMKLICNTDLDNKFIYNRVYVLCKFDVVQDHTNSFFTSRGHTIWGNIVCGFLRYDVVGIQHGWSFENLDYYFDACLK